MDRLRDRGNKKWTSIMLPEHVERLKKLFAENNQVERPILDEQQVLENDATLQAALKEDRTIQITYYTNNKLQTVKGNILFIDTFGGVVRLEDINVLWKDIIEVSTV